MHLATPSSTGAATVAVDAPRDVAPTRPAWAPSLDVSPTALVQLRGVMQRLASAHAHAAIHPPRRTGQG